MNVAAYAGQKQSNRTACVLRVSLSFGASAYKRRAQVG